MQDTVTAKNSVPVKIIIADDSPLLPEALKDLIRPIAESMGIEPTVHAAFDANDLVKRVNEDHYNVVVLGDRMIYKHKLDPVRNIREYEAEHQKKKVAIYVADGSESYRKEQLEGVDGLVIMGYGNENLSKDLAHILWRELNKNCSG
jgi:DNA-binding NarL/FixJ family response regulator